MLLTNIAEKLVYGSVFDSVQNLKKAGSMFQAQEIFSLNKREKRLTYINQLEK